MSMYKVITTSVDEDGYTIAAMKYQTIKFDYIESSYVSKTKRLSQAAHVLVNAPVVFTAADVVIDSPYFFGRTSMTYLVKWQHSPYIINNIVLFQPTYLITVTFPNGTSTTTSTQGSSPDAAGIIHGETRITVPTLQFSFADPSTYAAQLTFTIVATAIGMENSKPVTVVHTQGMLEAPIDANILSTLNIYEGR